MLGRGDAKLITPFLYSQAVIALVRFSSFFLYFIRKQQGSSPYLIEIGASSYTGMFGYLTAFQEMIEQVPIFCIKVGYMFFSARVHCMLS